MKIKKIGLTGGIGSGKTTVAKLFEKFGVPVFYSDIVAKESWRYKYIQEAINEACGEKVFTDDGHDKSRMVHLVFNNDNIRSKVNDVIKPYIMNRFKQFCEIQQERVYFGLNKSDLVMLESAILFDTGLHTKFDYNVLVTAPKQLRIKRVMGRDNVTREEVLQRMKIQMPEEDKIELADFIIMNDSNEPDNDLAEQTKDVFDKLY